MQGGKQGNSNVENCLCCEEKESDGEEKEEKKERVELTMKDK